jgi:hypothetical protein
VTDEIERGNAIVIARNRFSIDNAGARAQPARKYPATKQNTSATKAPTLEIIHASEVPSTILPPSVVPGIYADGEMRLGLHRQVPSRLARSPRYLYVMSLRMRPLSGRVRCVLPPIRRRATAQRSGR